MSSEVAIGDRVTYVDGDGETHRAIVIDDCEGDPYITCVTGVNGPLGEVYNHGTNDHSSTFLHTSLNSEQRYDTHAYLPGWDVELP